MLPIANFLIPPKLFFQEYINAIAMRLVTASNSFNGSSEERLKVGTVLNASAPILGACSVIKSQHY